MKSRKLKTAPSYHCRDMQIAIDHLVEYTITDLNAAIEARIYFYRTRLNMKPNQVAKIFDKHPHDVNDIAMRIGRRKSEKIQLIENTLLDKFPNYHLDRHKKHLRMIVKRINNRTLVAQDKATTVALFLVCFLVR